MTKFKNILLIEDDTFIAELYMRKLKQNGYEIKNVLSGPEGIKEAKTGQYDLILLDIMIPAIDGVEVLKTLRGSEGKGLPESKIVITTNLDQDEETKTELEPLVDGYIIKADVTPRKLLEYIQELEKTL